MNIAKLMSLEEQLDKGCVHCGHVFVESQDIIRKDGEWWHFSCYNAVKRQERNEASLNRWQC